MWGTDVDGLGVPVSEHPIDVMRRLESELAANQAHLAKIKTRLRYALLFMTLTGAGACAFGMAAFAQSGNWIWAALATSIMTITAFVVGFSLARGNL